MVPLCQGWCHSGRVPLSAAPSTRFRSRPGKTPGWPYPLTVRGVTEPQTRARGGGHLVVGEQLGKPAPMPEGAISGGFPVTAKPGSRAITATATAVLLCLYCPLAEFLFGLPHATASAAMSGPSALRSGTPGTPPGHPRSVPGGGQGAGRPLSRAPGWIWCAGAILLNAEFARIDLKEAARYNRSKIKAAIRRLLGLEGRVPAAGHRS